MRLKAVAAPVCMSILGIVVATEGRAQSSQSGEPADGQSAVIEEVMVTAQKRTQNAQEVPISIAAFNAATLEQTGVHELKSLSKITANFGIKRPVASTGLALQIRGIGALGNTAIEPSVATFLDGIYVPRAASVFGSFLDIESIEVLRGPQGTLFGRNASVGAVALQSATPKDYFEGSLKAEAGTGSRYRLEGMVNIPLADNAALRIAALGEQFDGYWKNRFSGKDYGGIDQAAVRASLKVNFSDNLTWTLRGEYNELDGSEYPNTDILAGTLSAAGLANLTERTGGRLPDLVTFDRYSNTYIDPANFGNDKQWSASSTLTLDFANDYTIRLLNGYRDYRNEQHDGDLTFLPIPILGRTNFFDSTSQSHELQFLTPTDQLFGGRFSAVAGLYFFKDELKLGENFLLLDEFCTLIAARVNPALVAPCQSGPSDATNGRFSQSLESFAAYAQGDIKLLDNVVLTLGVRSTDEKKDGLFEQTVQNGAGAILRGAEYTPLELSKGEITYRANLSWHPIENVHAYTSYSTGYKSGGFNSLGSGAPLGQARRIFGPETVKNIEVGVKTEWLDQRLVLNGTLYRMDVDGYQDRSAIDGISFTIRNSGVLRHQGLELDAQFAATEMLRFNLAAAYLDSEFLQFPGATNLPGLPGAQDLTGGYGHFAPEWSGAFGVQLDGDLFGSAWTWLARTDLTFQSESNVGINIDNNPETMQEGYQLLGARVSVMSPDDRWVYSLFGDNLTDEGYSLTNFYFLFDAQLGVRQPGGKTAINTAHGNPRTFGASIGYRF